MKMKTEFEAKNIKEAVAKACKKMKLKEDELRYEIISHGSTGIFGLAGVKKAKIRLKTDHPQNNLKERAKKEKKTIQTIEKDAVDLAENALIDENAVQMGEEILKRIVHTISENASIHIDKKPERIDFNVKGKKAGILIGKKGQTLEAIQLLVEKIVNKHNKSRIRVQVDIEDYLKNRRENLRNLAKKLSEKAKLLNKPMSLGQMNAMDRRTVHLALKEEPGVKTISSGKGYIKKIIIFPKD